MSVPIREASPSADSCEVAILGGGLAGLTLALQLRQRFPDADLRVLERRSGPLPVAAHKVGESTVEIGAHYFAETLGLRAHLDAEHIRKFGFRFFFSDRCDDVGAVTELGVSKVMPTPTWQIDRGVFETFLREEVQRRGIRLVEGASVRGVDLAADDSLHQVRYVVGDNAHALSARWVIDAAGRAGLLRRKLGLDASSHHEAHSVWFRFDDRVAVDGWCEDESWQALCTPRGERWRSTNHLIGPGYWVWLIPLGSGAHSVGIVADSNLHPFESMNSFDKALDWLQTHQPRLARECAARREGLLDFLFLRGYSHSSRQVFSGDRWALTGDAGVFLDPFYSPGSDFIAIANTYITELIALDRAGKPVAPYARLYEQVFMSFFESTMSLYRGQYPLFGNPEVMPLKVIWDYAYYWGVLCQLVFQNAIADVALLGELRLTLERAKAMNLDMQAFFRTWHAASKGENAADMLDQQRLDWFVAMNRSLHDALDREQLMTRLGANVEFMAALADAIRARAARSCPSLAQACEGRDAADISMHPPLFERAA